MSAAASSPYSAPPTYMSSRPMEAAWPLPEHMPAEDWAAAERRSDEAFRRAAARRRRPLPSEILLDAPLELEAAAAIAEGIATVTIGDAATARMRAAYQRLLRCVEERRSVYGVTTGFGPMSDRLVARDDLETLQRHRVYHLATGVGQPMSWQAARATVLARLSSISRGWSGASETAVDLLTALLNSPYAPLIPEQGAAGASGDLSPLAHVALALMGEGGFIDRHGRQADTIEVFYKLGRPPLSLQTGDGAAVVNGAAAMTGVSVMNSVIAARLLSWSEVLTVAYAELLNGRLEAWRAEFSEARPYPGQAAAAAVLRDRAAGSRRLDERASVAQGFSEDPFAAAPRDSRALQDASSIRCAPQVLGAVRDMLSQHDQTVRCELNAVSDNPIFSDSPEIVLHGGNFMGCHVAFAADALRNAVVVLGGFAERQISRLADETRNGELPAYLHRGAPGLNGGLMGAQATAIALMAELRTHGGSASIQAITSHAGDQDVASMGAVAARGCAAALEDVSRILAIQTLAVAQAVDIVAVSAGTDGGDDERAGFAEARVDVAARAAGFSASTATLAAWTRRRSAALRRDRPLSADIETLAVDLRASGFSKIKHI